MVCSFSKWWYVLVWYFASPIRVYSCLVCSQCSHPKLWYVPTQNLRISIQNCGVFPPQTLVCSHQQKQTNIQLITKKSDLFPPQTGMLSLQTALCSHPKKWYVPTPNCGMFPPQTGYVPTPGCGMLPSQAVVYFHLKLVCSYPKLW